MRTGGQRGEEGWRGGEDRQRRCGAGRLEGRRWVEASEATPYELLEY